MMERYKLVRDLVPVGTVLENSASQKTERFVPHYEVVVGIGADYTANFIVDAEAVESNPDYFEKL
jgi:hypothetical protein